MFCAVRNFIHKILGERWEYNTMSNGIGCRLVFNRTNELTHVVLRHLPTYNKSSIADSRGSFRVGVRDGEWRKIVEYARSKGEGFQKPYNIGFDQKRDRIYYSIDGEVFSIPCQSVEEIDAHLASQN